MPEYVFYITVTTLVFYITVELSLPINLFTDLFYFYFAGSQEFFFKFLNGFYSL